VLGGKRNCASGRARREKARGVQCETERAAPAQNRVESRSAAASFLPHRPALARWCASAALSQRQWNRRIVRCRAQAGEAPAAKCSWQYHQVEGEVSTPPQRSVSTRTPEKLRSSRQSQSGRIHGRRNPATQSPTHPRRGQRPGTSCRQEELMFTCRGRDVLAVAKAVVKASRVFFRIIQPAIAVLPCRCV